MQYLFIIFLILSYPFASWAACPGSGATRTTASCTAAEIQECHDVEGVTTINVPADSCTWATTNQVAITKYISILGNGIDSTVITDNTTRSTSPWTINVTSASDGVVKISGFTFSEAGAVSSIPLISGGLYGANTGGQVIISGNKFNGVLRQPFLMGGLRGLFYGNTFLSSTRGKIVGPGVDSSGVDNWDDSWTKATVLGSVNAWYFEDNTFTTPVSGIDGNIDCEYGGKYVVRYNTVTFDATNENTHAFFGHGLDSVFRGCASIEVYSNNISCPAAPTWFFSPIMYRGGTGIVFNNTFTGKFSHTLSMLQHRSCSNSGYYAAVGHCAGGTYDKRTLRGQTQAGQTYYDLCINGGGTAHYENCTGSNPIDGNTGANGYPCIDQIGRGGNQELLPIYQWGNTLNGDAITWTTPTSTPGCTGTDYITDHLQVNRDYYNAEKTGFTPYGTLVGGRYYHSSRSDIPAVTSTFTGTTTGKLQ